MYDSCTQLGFSKPISVLANTTHALATKLHLIPVSASDVESGGYSQVPGSARAEAERRRYGQPPSPHDLVCH